MLLIYNYATRKELLFMRQNELLFFQEGKENAIIHKAKGSVDKYNSKYLRDVLKSRMSDSQKESFLEEFYMVMTNKKETDGEEQNMYVGGIHGKKMKNPEPFLQYKPKTVCKSS